MGGKGICPSDSKLTSCSDALELCSLGPSVCPERSRMWKSNHWVLGGAEETEDREMSAPWDSCPDQEGRKVSEERVPENLRVKYCLRSYND